jgi:hypothetical protein
MCNFVATRNSTPTVKAASVIDVKVEREDDDGVSVISTSTVRQGPKKVIRYQEMELTSSDEDDHDDDDDDKDDDEESEKDEPKKNNNKTNGRGAAVAAVVATKSTKKKASSPVRSVRSATQRKSYKEKGTDDEEGSDYSLSEGDEDGKAMKKTSASSKRKVTKSVANKASSSKVKVKIGPASKTGRGSSNNRSSNNSVKKGTRADEDEDKDDDDDDEDEDDDDVSCMFMICKVSHLMIKQKCKIKNLMKIV